MTPEFKEWPKILRGTGDETITITEKMDGTNGAIIVDKMEDTGQLYVAGVQSRKRIITPGADTDNFGFAGYVMDNCIDIAEKLGEGYHYGEWAGEGIQKNPHCIVGRKFYLFNSNRWRFGRQERPAGMMCVPVLYEAEWYPEVVEDQMDDLWLRHMHDGFYTPEGIVVWYHKTRRFEKHTFAMSEGKWKHE